MVMQLVRSSFKLTSVLHLSQGANVTGLTTLPSDVTSARGLVSSVYPESSVEYYTGSASYTRGKDVDHPLNPERVLASGPAQPFDLIYALDVAYHIPPTVYQFAANAHSALRERGVLAYTDVLPPAKLTSFPGRILGMWLALPLGVPHRNVIDRPASLDEYKAELEQMGYDNVRIEDWSSNVWEGLADNLEKREGKGWKLAAKGFRYAGKHGWKYIAVRGERGTPPSQQTAEEQEEEHNEHHDEKNEKEAEL